MASNSTITNRGAAGKTGDSAVISTTEKGRPSRPTASRLAFIFAILRLLSLPLRLLYIIPASNRPVPTWSYKTAFGAVLWRTIFKFLADVHIRGSRSLAPGKDKDILVLAKPGSPDLYQGPLIFPSVKPNTVPSLWGPTVPPSSGFEANQSLVLHFHGGAYVSFSARGLELRRGAIQICNELGSAYALCVDYRKASDTGCSHFPAQLQDAVTAYSHALELVKTPDQIILSGDSAGGHLVLSLVRYLEQFNVLPKPKAALLHSPWLDLTEAGVSMQNNRNEPTDLLPAEWITWGAEAFTAPGMERDNEWISPSYHPFHTTVPIWVQAGGKEAFYDVIERWVSDMKSKGTKVELWTIPNAPHDPFGLSPEIGMENEEREALVNAVEFVRAI